MKDDKYTELKSREEMLREVYDELYKDFLIEENDRIPGISHDGISMFSDSKYSMLLFNIRNNIDCIQKSFKNLDFEELDLESELNNVKEYHKTK